MSIINTTDTSFQNDVLKSEIPVVVEFSALWCSPCKTLTPILDELSKTYDKVKFVKIDVDNNGIASMFDVMSIPTTIMFKNGKPVDSIIGLASVQTYKDKIKKLL